MLDTIIYIPTILAYVFISLLVVILCFIVIYVSHKIYISVYDNLPVPVSSQSGVLGVDGAGSSGKQHEQSLATTSANSILSKHSSLTRKFKKAAVRSIINPQSCYLAYVIFETGMTTIKSPTTENPAELPTNNDGSKYSSNIYSTNKISLGSNKDRTIKFNEMNANEDGANNFRESDANNPREDSAENREDCGAGNGEDGAEKREDGAEKREDGAEKRENGAESREDGAENREDSAENREVGAHQSREDNAATNNETIRDSYNNKLIKYYDRLSDIPRGRVMKVCHKSGRGERGSGSVQMPDMSVMSNLYDSIAIRRTSYARRA